MFYSFHFKIVSDINNCNIHDLGNYIKMYYCIISSASIIISNKILKIMHSQSNDLCIQRIVIFIDKLYTIQGTNLDHTEVNHSIDHGYPSIS